MARVIGIDYGFKRTGLAVTDPEQRIATPLEVIESSKLLSYLNQYIKKEKVEIIVVGEPKHLDGRDTHTSEAVRQLVAALKNKFPEIRIDQVDERFTSKMALDAMLVGGMKKKDRRKKGNVDKISATIILQSWLESRNSQF
jgi:putative Holliday junction resolvase